MPPVVTPCLWFDGNAEEAAQYYISVFKNGKIISDMRTSKAVAANSGQKEGSVLGISIEIDGHPFFLLNGGPDFKFTPAISFMVYRDTQEEIDYLWNTLVTGSPTEQCGWALDKFGVHWQIIPTQMKAMIESGDQEKIGKMMEAMLKMTKLDIAKLDAAFNS